MSTLEPTLDDPSDSLAVPSSAAAAKWGEALSMGFAIVPSVLIRAQAKLGLDAVDLAVLLNVIIHWWTPGEWPYPQPRVLANRMAVSTRTVERRLESLEKRGFLIRHPPEKSSDGLARRRIDLSGLVGRLQGFARAGLAMRQEWGN
jgi:DnaD N-terminal domain